jgi:hypothetical protein
MLKIIGIWASFGNLYDLKTGGAGTLRTLWTRFILNGLAKLMKMIVLILTHYSTGWIVMMLAVLWVQVSGSYDRIISESFDYGISLALLVIGITALALHYMKDKKTQFEYTQKRDAAFESLQRETISVMVQQTETNRQLKDSIDKLESRINS